MIKGILALVKNLGKFNLNFHTSKFRSCVLTISLTLAVADYMSISGANDK